MTGMGLSVYSPDNIFIEPSCRYKLVFSIISEDPKKFVTFLKSQKGISFDDEIVFNLKEISRIYNIEDLNKLAEKYKDNPILSSEEKETIGVSLKAYQDFKKNE